MGLYYKFVDVDIDRYQIDGAQQQVYLSARELDQSSLYCLIRRPCWSFLYCS